METIKVYWVLGKAQRAVQKSGVAVFSVLLLISFLASIGISHRGLDFTDESFYILSSVYPDRQVSGLSFFHYFTAQIWTAAQSIHFFRLSSIVISAIFSYVLMRQISMYLPSKSRGSLIKSFLTIFGSYLIYGSLINFSPSYNLIVAWITPVVVLLMFKSFTTISNFESFKYLFCSSIGLLLLFNVKFSVPFSAFFILAALTIAFPAINRNLIISRMFALGLTFALLITLELTVLKIGSFDFQYFANGYLALSQIQSDGSFGHFIVVVLRTIKRLGYLMVAIIGLYVVHRLSRSLTRNVRAISFVFYGIFISVLLKLFYASSGNWTGQALAFHLIVCLFVITRRSKLQDSQVHKSLILILLILPYVMSIGTNNIYFEQTLFYLAPWAIALLILDKADFQKFYKQGSFVISMVFSLHLVTALFTPAYGLEGSYIRKTVPVNINGYGTLLFSASEARFIGEMSAVKRNCNLTDDYGFLGFENSGGLAIPLGLPPLGNSWTTSKFQAELNLTDSNRSQEIVIAFRSPFADDQRLVPDELDFPEAFVFCARVELSDRQVFGIWKKNR